MHTAVFSIVSPNYRHFARVLMASVRRHHPEWERFVLLIGEGPDGDRVEEPFTTVPLEALALRNPRQFCFRYSILELNTAVKPWMFKQLFALGYERVIYLDPDIVVYSPLVELEVQPAGTFLMLTPHLTAPLGGDDHHPSERTILLAGTYNLGFLAVTRQPPLAEFLAWWQEKLEFQCVVDTAQGLFVDQKWMDLAPGLFPGVLILRHEGYNVAYWNLGQRAVVSVDGGTTVNGQPLRFFHFSGGDSARPSLVSKHDERLKLSAVGGARKLIEEYRAALREAGSETFRNAPYAFGAFADGTAIPEAARIAYRNSSQLQSAAGSDPFEHPELFTRFTDKPRRSQLEARMGVISYRVLSRARPLVGLIPRPLRTAMREFLLGRREPAPRIIREKAPLEPGLNIVGYVARDTGVGESARLCRNACERVGLATHVIDVDAADGLPPQAVCRASIHHVNADQILEVHGRIGHVFDASWYNIGCWHWELPELPDAWIPSAAVLDEIWAPSLFVQSAVSRKVTVPVVHMPHGIEVTSIEPCSPEELGVSRGRFTFLCMFDLDSVAHRKNPLGAVEAFRRAFPHESSAALLIKAGHADRHPKEYAELEERLRGVPNVYLTDRMLSRAQANGLLAACDAIVSLHRSEGFGLILAEAMYLGKPVVATGWSGNMDFMNSANSGPVGYELVPLDRSYVHFQEGQHWAEPDLDHAAHLMLRVFEDPTYRTRIGERARQTMRTQFSPEAAGLRYRRRLEFLGLMERRA
jgi:glycosyltransferase involved in cell wall biosynthesis